MTDERRSHGNNVAGPFYVENDCCTACGVPEAVAPAMFEYDAADHCYVSRQPESAEEFERALQVLRRQELGCIRYRGTDPVILRRLAEAGEASSCDHPLLGVEPILRNTVTFSSNGPTEVTFDEFLEYMRQRFPGVALRSTSRTAGALSISWFGDNSYELTLVALDPPNSGWVIRHNGPLGVSEWLHSWLADTSKCSEIRWYSDWEFTHGSSGQERLW